MDDNSEETIEPEARREEEKAAHEGNDGAAPMRDEGLDRSASGALRPLGD